MTLSDQDVLALHRGAIVVDAHSDIFTDVVFRRQKGEHAVFQTHHLPVLRAAGIDVVFAAAYIEPEYKPERSQKRALEILGAALADLDETAGVAEVIRSRDDLRRIEDDGRPRLLLGLEGGEPVEDNIESLRAFYEMGVRFLGLTWNQRNRLADGIDEVGGLTRPGIAVVREANRLGVVLDVSHMSPAGFWDVLKHSKDPIVASHCSSRHVRDHPRNLTDDQIKATAENGGVVGVCFASPHLSATDATVESIADHIDHMVSLVGPSHVGLGPDFAGYLWDTGALAAPVGGPHKRVRGMEDATKLPDLTRLLLQRGYSEADIRQVLGGSFIRLLERVLR